MKKKDEKTVGDGYIDSIIEYIQKNRLQTFYNLVLIVIILVQSPFMIAGLDSVTVNVDMPPRGIITIRNDRANKMYYRLWAEHFANNTEYKKTNKKTGQVTQHSFSIMDFDYLNVEDKMAYLMKYYKQRKLIQDRKKLVNFVKNVKLKMISQTFDVEKIKIRLYENGHKAEAIYDGVAFQKYGMVKDEPKICKYTIDFSRNGGKLYVEAISTTCFDGRKVKKEKKGNKK